MRQTLSLLIVLLLGAACSSGSRSSAPTTLATTTTTVPPRLTGTVSHESIVDPSFRQGIARNGDGWIFSLNDGLFRTDGAFKIVQRKTPGIPARWAAQGYDHIGDIDVVDGILYAPLEQGNYARGIQAMVTYDANTLKYLGGVEIRTHHNSFVTVDPVTHIAYSQDRFGGTDLTRYDVTQNWKRLPKITMSRFVDKVQGADLRDGRAWLSTDDAHDGVYSVDLGTGAVQRLGSIGHVDGEGEGIDATPTASGDLHVLSADVKIVPMRVIDLAVTARPSTP